MVGNALGERNTENSRKHGKKWWCEIVILLLIEYYINRFGGRNPRIGVNHVHLCPSQFHVCECFNFLVLFRTYDVFLQIGFLCCKGLTKKMIVLFQCFFCNLVVLMMIRCLWCSGIYLQENSCLRDYNVVPLKVIICSFVLEEINLTRSII